MSFIDKIISRTHSASWNRSYKREIVVSMSSITMVRNYMSRSNTPKPINYLPKHSQPWKKNTNSMHAI